MIHWTDDFVTEKNNDKLWILRHFKVRHRFDDLYLNMTFSVSLGNDFMYPDQHHWLEVATEDEGWCSFTSCTPSRSRARRVSSIHHFVKSANAAHKRCIFHTYERGPLTGTDIVTPEVTLCSPDLQTAWPATERHVADRVALMIVRSGVQYLLLYDRCGGRIWCRVNCSLPSPRILGLAGPVFRQLGRAGF